MNEKEMWCSGLLLDDCGAKISQGRHTVPGAVQTSWGVACQPERPVTKAALPVRDDIPPQVSPTVGRKILRLMEMAKRQPRP